MIDLRKKWHSFCLVTCHPIEECLLRLQTDLYITPNGETYWKENFLIESVDVRENTFVVKASFKSGFSAGRVIGEVRRENKLTFVQGEIRIPRWFYIYSLPVPLFLAFLCSLSALVDPVSQMTVGLGSLFLLISFLLLSPVIAHQRKMRRIFVDMLKQTLDAKDVNARLDIEKELNV